MILGVFTQLGIAKTIDARNNEGFDIFVQRFGVSTIAGALDDTRTTPNTELYNGLVSGRIALNQNTIKVICTIPQGIGIGLQEVNEIYLYAKDSLGNDFMLCLGQPQAPITYDPTGTVTLELQISLVNVNLTALYNFDNTIAVELFDHNHDPNAHWEYVKELRHAGIKVDAGPFNEFYEGAIYDKRAEFEGTKATAISGGITFSSTYNGTEGNTISLVFDGIKTVDQIRHAWNTSNPDNTVEHSGLGTEVLPIQTLNLLSGTYLVSQLDLVYKATDGLYKKALAGTVGVQSKPFGLAYLNERTVKPLGLHKITHAWPIGSNLFLSNITAGQITTTATPVKIGYVHGINTIALNLGPPSEGTVDGYDAVVTDVAGAKNFPTTQQAIDFVSSNSRILVDKLEYLSNTLTTTAKRLDFFFSGKKSGWQRYAGTNEQHLIQFSAVPTSGTWRIVYTSLLKTTDLAYNANAAAVQAAINLVFPSNLCTVTGNYTIGFTITHAQLADVPNPYFTDIGQNSIQTFLFSNIPDNGSFAANYNGQTTAALAYNDTNAQFKTYLEALSNVTSVNVTGSFTVGLSVEFTGVDGLQPKFPLGVASIPVNSLALGVSPTSISMAITQIGEYSANSLLNGVTPIVITPNIVVEGTAIGNTKAIIVDQPFTTFTGLGLIKNFTDGIDLNSKLNCDIELTFENTTNPILSTGLSPNSDFRSVNSFGIPHATIRTVGQFGDHATLVLAIAASNIGDKIQVMQDQTITTNLICNKDIEIEFFNGSKINVLSNISGSVIQLGSKTKTKNLSVYVNHASTFSNIVLFYNELGHHSNFGIETASIVTVTGSVILFDTSCLKIFVDGFLTLNSATIASPLIDNSTIKDSNWNIRTPTTILTSLVQSPKILKHFTLTASQAFAIPQDVSKIFVSLCGGGGGGGSSGPATSGGGAGIFHAGGGGGGGSVPISTFINVIPSSAITCVIGGGGGGGSGQGGASYILGPNNYFASEGGAGGGAGGQGQSGAGGGTVISSFYGSSKSQGGQAGTVVGQINGQSGAVGGSGGSSTFSTGGIGGLGVGANGNGGGGGGAGFGLGGVGGSQSATPTGGGYGAGGGGGGATSQAGASGGQGIIFITYESSF